MELDIGVLDEGKRRKLSHCVACCEYYTDFSREKRICTWGIFSVLCVLCMCFFVVCCVFVVNSIS